MNEIIEKRRATRVNISCELRFRTLDSDTFYDACCIDLSSSGVLFCSEHTFQIGERIEMQIIPDPPIRFSTTVMVTVVRIGECQHDGLFEVGVNIDYDDADLSYSI